MASQSGLVRFDRVWKKFHRGELHDSLRDLIPAVAKKLVGRGEKKSELSEGDFWAVRDLSFEVKPGQTLGIIGPNGSGKSTTLKMLTRILEPSRGWSEVRGRIGTLIEVSAGFHGDLTGRENVFLQGAIMGMRGSDITRKFDEIVEFAGVSESIDTQVKRYSSGMNARLGFAIAAHLEPDVLIIDEVLAVGDLTFQERAFGRIRALARSGIPVVMVSHQLDRIAELCSDAILLNRGEVVARGTAEDAIGAYIKHHDTQRRTTPNGRVVFEDVRLTDGRPVRSGDRCELIVDLDIPAALESTIEPLKIRVRSLASGAVVYATGSRGLGVRIPSPGRQRVAISLQANLPAGGYIIEIAAGDSVDLEDIDFGPSAMLNVTEASDFRGTVQLNASMTPAPR